MIQIEIYLSDKLIKPFSEGEETSYTLAWDGTLSQLKINSIEDDKILESIFFKLNSERPENFPADFRTFSVGDVVSIEGRAYKCLAEGWQEVDNFKTRNSHTIKR